MAHNVSTELVSEGQVEGLLSIGCFSVKRTYTVIDVFFTFLGEYLLDGISAVAAMRTEKAVITAICTKAAEAATGVRWRHRRRWVELRQQGDGDDTVRSMRF